MQKSNCRERPLSGIYHRPPFSFAKLGQNFANFLLNATKSRANSASPPGLAFAEAFSLSHVNCLLLYSLFGAKIKFFFAWQKIESLVDCYGSEGASCLMKGGGESGCSS